MNTKRLNTIDVAKGIGILLVVFAHVYYGPNMLVLVYSFHMPLFFIFSGMLFNRERNPDCMAFIKKRAKRLLVPYVIYEVVSIFCLYGAERVFTGVFDISKMEYVEYFRQILISNWSGAHVNQPLWFLPSLFIVEVMYYFFSRGRKVTVVLISVALAFCGWVLESGMLEFDNMCLPWNLDSAIFALGFYAFGNLFAEKAKKLIEAIGENKFKLPICIGIMLALSIVWIPLALMNGKITLGTKILNNGFLLYATGILGTLIVLTLSILLRESKFLAYCGRHSFEIMASHYIFRKCLVRPLYIVLKGKAYNRKVIEEAWLPFLIVLLLSLLFTVAYDRISAFFVKKKKLKLLNES